VTYGTHDELGEPEGTNLVKPVYHVAWLASRLGMHVVQPLTPAVTKRPGGRPGGPRGGARPAPPRPPRPPRPPPLPPRLPAPRPRRDPTVSPRRGGRARRAPRPPPLRPARGRPPGRVAAPPPRRAGVCGPGAPAEADGVHCRVGQDGVGVPQRPLNPPRRNDV